MKVKLTVEIELTDTQMADYAYEYGLRATEASVRSDMVSNIETGLKSGIIADFATVKVTRAGR